MPIRIRVGLGLELKRRYVTKECNANDLQRSENSGNRYSGLLIKLVDLKWKILPKTFACIVVFYLLCTDDRIHVTITKPFSIILFVSAMSLFLSASLCLSLSLSISLSLSFSLCLSIYLSIPLCRGL